MSAETDGAQKLDSLRETLESIDTLLAEEEYEEAIEMSKQITAISNCVLCQRLQDGIQIGVGWIQMFPTGEETRRGQVRRQIRQQRQLIEEELKSIGEDNE